MGSALKVLILAGGLGTRIRELFPDRPKSMIPFNGKPFLEHQMHMLTQQGFRSFVLCVGHRAEQIKDYFGDGERWGFEIHYSHESSPLGTGGALRYAVDFFKEAVMILNGDTYLAMDYAAMAAAHAQTGDAIGTIAVSEIEDTAASGQVLLDDTGKISAFREKIAAQSRGLVNAGAYIFTPEVLEFIPAGQKVSLENSVFPALLKTHTPFYGFRTANSFIDIGTPVGYKKLKDILL